MLRRLRQWWSDPDRSIVGGLPSDWAAIHGQARSTHVDRNYERLPGDELAACGLKLVEVWAERDRYRELVLVLRNLVDDDTKAMVDRRLEGMVAPDGD
jgi:hypothetical protein